MPRVDVEERRAYQKAYYESSKGKAWARNLKNKYGITPADYESLLVAQDGCCAICRTDTDPYGRAKFCVDHDHTTGAVRGLLCNNCNRTLGLFGDDPARLERAAAYLRDPQ